MGKACNYCKTMSTIPKTNLGQINFRTTIVGVGSECLRRGKCASICTSRMEKDEDLQEMIPSTHCVYARRLKMAWHVKNWDRKSSKVSWIEQLTYVLDFHEFRMIHGR